jgi:hypothetical protein
MDPRDPSGAGRHSPRRRSGGSEPLRLERRESPAGIQWEFVHPRCARKRREDLEEVESMMEAGETEIARDELVWLLSECPDFLEAHVRLGLIALEDDDPKLARGHFGRGYELGLRAIDAAGGPQPLPHALTGNQPFFEAAKGLVHCLLATGRQSMAKDVWRRIAPLDPADPLGIGRLLPSR